MLEPCIPGCQSSNYLYWTTAAAEAAAEAAAAAPHHHSKQRQRQQGKQLTMQFFNGNKLLSHLS